jgi:pimeloyl-ACP methyl ester carboxylesterase
VVACGGGVSIREQVLNSMRTDLKTKGFNEGVIDSVIIFSRQLYTYLGTGIGYPSVDAAYGLEANQPWFSFFKDMHFTEQLPPPSMLKEPVFNFFKAINYDPQSTLRALEVPTLVILAGKDETVPSGKSKQLWEDAFYAGDHQDKLSVSLLPDENHYDFERINGTVVYKKTFADILIKWLHDKIIK